MPGDMHDCLKVRWETKEIIDVWEKDAKRMRNFGKGKLEIDSQSHKSN